MPNLLAHFLEQVRHGDIVLAVAAVLLLSSAFYRAAALPLRVHFKRINAVSKLAWHMGVLLALEQAYEFSRGRISHEADVALPNAYRILDLEMRHGFFVENRIERFFLHFHLLMNAIDIFYVVAHVAVTIGGLIYLYVRRRQHFWFARRLLIVTSAIALVAFYVYPTAPPRLLTNYGFVDPAQLQHLVDAGGAQPDSYTYNPYAAMPSLHMGYALAISWSLFLAERRLVIKMLACLYPVVMGAVVIISGNHWMLDVVGAIVTVLMAAALIGATTSLTHLIRRWVCHVSTGSMRMDTQ